MWIAIIIGGWVLLSLLAVPRIGRFVTANLQPEVDSTVLHRSEEESGDAVIDPAGKLPA